MRYRNLATLWFRLGKRRRVPTDGWQQGVLQGFHRSVGSVRHCADPRRSGAVRLESPTQSMNKYRSLYDRFMICQVMQLRAGSHLARELSDVREAETGARRGLGSRRFDDGETMMFRVDPQGRGCNG